MRKSIYSIVFGIGEFLVEGICNISEYMYILVELEWGELLKLFFFCCLERYCLKKRISLCNLGYYLGFKVYF